MASANAFDSSCHRPPCALVLQGDSFEQVAGVRSTDRLEDVHIPSHIQFTHMSSSAGIVQEEKASSARTWNDIELIADSGLTAESVLPQCSKSKPTLQHIIADCCMSSDRTG